MLAYRLLRSFLRFVLSVFFRNLEVVGREHIPTDGAIIFAGNHPNSLMDPLLVLTQSGRIIHFAAKDVLFESRFLRIFLRILGAVPIRRRMDHGGEDVNNQDAFEALFAVLAKGGCMGIFPEGISHTDSELSRFKTGAARIALGVKTAYPQIKLSIVPVGLTFLHRQRFRSQALMHFGEAIAIDDAWQARYQQDEKTAVRELTNELEQEIRALTINAPDWETMRVMSIARRIYRPDRLRLSLEEYAELTRRFADGLLRLSNEPMIQALKRELEDYQARLDAFQIRDHDLRREPTLWQICGRILGRLAYLMILLPLALPGMLLHAPVWVTAIVAGDGLTQRKDVVSTTKLIASILTVPLLYAVVAFGVGWPCGIGWGLLTFALLPLTGFATIRVLEQQVAIGKSVQAVLRLLRFHREVQEMRALRQALFEKVHAAVDRYHDPNVPRIIPKNQTAAE